MGQRHVKRAGSALAIRYQAGSLNGSKVQLGGEAEHDYGDARQNVMDMQAAARRKGPSDAPAGQSRALVDGGSGQAAREGER